MKTTKRHLFLGLLFGLSFVLLAAACSTAPVKAPPADLLMCTPPPPPPPRLDFPGVAKHPIEDRSQVSAQAAVEEANRLWSARATDRSDYLRAARLLMSALEEGAYSTSEEEVRLSTIALQHALLADDAVVLRVALRHWEHGYQGIRFAPNSGEVETYLLAARRVGVPLASELVAIAHPDIQIVLGLEK